ncbi:MAG TPA: hypothetical protein DEA96_09195 [Leptospiraceae bacterium]|nr:hypothetical protein [Leptospiraceae bacterium]
MNAVSCENLPAPMKESNVKHLLLFPDRSLFVGALSDNGMHSHHALQIVCSQEPVSIQTEKGTLESSLTVIAPNVRHAVSGNHPAQSILLIDGESSLCQSIEASTLVKNDVLTLEYPASFPSLISPGCQSSLEWMDALLSKLPGNPHTSRPVSLDPRIASACAYIQKDPDLKASLIELAQHTGLSEGRFTHLFKEQMGIPLRKYILWLRLRKSVSALQHGMSLTDAAHEAGFADQAHMSRSFKESFGSSPADLLTARGNVRITFCQDGAD